MSKLIFTTSLALLKLNHLNHPFQDIENFCFVKLYFHSLLKTVELNLQVLLATMFQLSSCGCYTYVFKVFLVYFFTSFMFSEYTVLYLYPYK